MSERTDLGPLSGRIDLINEGNCTSYSFNGSQISDFGFKRFKLAKLSLVHTRVDSDKNGGNFSWF